MAHVVQGDREVFSQVLFGAPPPELNNYIQQTQMNFIGTITDIGRQFVDTARETFARIDQSEAMRLARTALRVTNVLFQDDVIYEIQTINDVQAAPSIMVPYIMTHPLLRQYYLNDEIDAYGGRYIDTNPGHPGGWGLYHYDVLHSGMIETVIPDNEDEEPYDEFTEVFFENEDEVDQLLPEERVMIMNTLDNVVNQAIYEGRDPTSIWDSQLVK